MQPFPEPQHSEKTLFRAQEALGVRVKALSQKAKPSRVYDVGFRVGHRLYYNRPGYII